MGIATANICNEYYTLVEVSLTYFILKAIKKYISPYDMGFFGLEDTVFPRILCL